MGGVGLNYLIMHDFQTINEIVSESVRNSSYYTVAISSCVFILYALITNLVSYFKTKSKNKPLIEISKAMVEMTENIVKLNTILDKTFKDAERKEISKCKQVIDLAFRTFASRISQQCESVIANNNIEKNKEFITDNIAKLVSTEYYKLYSILSAYEINEVNVASKLKEEWIDNITKKCLQIIYSNQDSLNRIKQLNDRLIIITEEHSIYINNKVFNH